jgi:signal transduction histidine kinase
MAAIKQTIYESYRKYNNFGNYFKATVEDMNLGWFISIVIFIIGSLLAFFIAAKEFELPFRKPKTYGWLLKKGVFSWYYLEGLNLFKYAASEYRKEVLNNGYDYEIFIEQFCVKNLPQVNFESDKKSRLGDIVAREMLYDILKNKKTFTKKYFKRGKFTTADFLELRGEYNKGNAKDDAINIDLYSQQLVYTRTREEMLELVKEQEMKSVNSFISGQEKERARIASDLHDRLGSLLSTVKLHFSSIEPYFENEPELSENFSYAISLLDQSVTEVRSVSHNLAKEILTEFGLVGAIENLRDSINSASILKFVFVNTGFNLRLSYEIEIEIYRIIQELVTNVIKHANATELVIQFVADEETLSITVEDDGVGFDIDKVKKDGLGLHNIFNRTATIKGKYAIDSAPGAGTSFIFDFPITALTSKQQ